MLTRSLGRNRFTAMLALLAALWLQVAQPLLLAGHLASCDAAHGCAHGCSHETPVEPALAAADDGAAAPGHRHDDLHCVLCRTLQLLGKALSLDADIAAGGGLLASAAAVPTASGHPFSVPLSVGGPRAPPTC